MAYSLSPYRNILLLERDLSEPDRIVGELLQPGGVIALDKLGMGSCLEGIDATPVEGYAVVTGDRMVGVPYPALEAMAGDKVKRIDEEEEAALAEHNEGKEAVVGRAGKGTSGGAELEGGRPWHVEAVSGRKEGRSFHHGRLISSLRRKVIEESDATVLEATVRDLIYCDHTDRVIGVTAAFKIAKQTPPYSSTPASASGSSDGTASPVEYETVVRNIYSPLTIIADGCFSKFRTTRGSRLPATKTRSHFVGAVLHDAELPLPRHGTVCLTPSGPVLFYQIGYEAKETRMLVDVKGKLPSVADGSLKVRPAFPLLMVYMALGQGGGMSMVSARSEPNLMTEPPAKQLRPTSPSFPSRTRHYRSHPTTASNNAKYFPSSFYAGPTVTIPLWSDHGW